MFLFIGLAALIFAFFYATTRQPHDATLTALFVSLGGFAAISIIYTLATRRRDNGQDFSDALGQQIAQFNSLTVIPRVILLAILLLLPIVVAQLT